MISFPYVLRMWSPCSLGGGPECPCTPPLDARCPEDGCRVLGDHDKHNNGLGTVWWHGVLDWFDADG